MGTSFAEYTIPIIWGTMMRKRKIGLERKLRKGGRGPTHYVIDCHDFAEDDTVCGGHFSRLCFEEVVGVYADLIRFLRMREGLDTTAEDG
jgi:hypothetical protein